MDIIHCMKNFICVTDSQSFNKAARIMQISTGTMTKHINYLEKWLGKRLLHRTTRKVEASMTGKKFYHEAKELLIKIDKLREIPTETNFQPTGKIRLNIPSTFNEGILLPTIFDYLKKYPTVKISITSRPYLDDLINNDTDIVITLKKKHTVDVDGFKLFELKRGFYATPAYLKQMGKITTVTDLKKHNCLIFTDKYLPKIWNLSNNKKVTVDGRLTADNFNLLKQAAINGLGILHIAESFVSNEIKTRKLIPILTTHHALKAEMYVYYSRYRLQPLLKHFLEFLKEQWPNSLHNRF